MTDRKQQDGNSDLGDSITTQRTCVPTSTIKREGKEKAYQRDTCTARHSWNIFTTSQF